MNKNNLTGNFSKIEKISEIMGFDEKTKEGLKNMIFSIREKNAKFDVNYFYNYNFLEKKFS